MVRITWLHIPSSIETLSIHPPFPCATPTNDTTIPSQFPCPSTSRPSTTPSSPNNPEPAPETTKTPSLPPEGAATAASGGRGSGLGAPDRINGDRSGELVSGGRGSGLGAPERTNGSLSGERPLAGVGEASSSIEGGGRLRLHCRSRSRRGRASLLWRGPTAWRAGLRGRRARDREAGPPVRDGDVLRRPAGARSGGEGRGMAGSGWSSAWWLRFLGGFVVLETVGAAKGVAVNRWRMAVMVPWRENSAGGHDF